MKVHECRPEGNEDFVATMARALREGLFAMGGDDGIAASEERLLKVGNAILRQALEGILQEFAEKDGPTVRVGEKTYRRHEPASVRYHSLVG